MWFPSLAVRRRIGSKYLPSLHAHVSVDLKNELVQRVYFKARWRNRTGSTASGPDDEAV